MPLQNRVSPFGELFATSARGTLFGNRGGKFHADGKALTKRRWASRQWICCVLDFKGRQRDVWGRYYTELFFLDEVTAFAAGHRPCFECRRRDAEHFARLFAGNETRATADAMDDVITPVRSDHYKDPSFQGFDETASTADGSGMWPIRFTIPTAPATVVGPSGQPAIARTWFSNWLVAAPSIVQ